MWRRPELQRLEEEAEAQLCFLGANVEQREDPALQRGVMDANAAAADFAAVQHEIVGLCAGGTWLALHLREILVVRRGERMVHRVVTLLRLVPFEEGEVD